MSDIESDNFLSSFPLFTVDLPNLTIKTSEMLDVESKPILNGIYTSNFYKAWGKQFECSIIVKKSH